MINIVYNLVMWCKFPNYIETGPGKAQYQKYGSAKPSPFGNTLLKP